MRLQSVLNQRCLQTIRQEWFITVKEIQRLKIRVSERRIELLVCLNAVWHYSGSEYNSKATLVTSQRPFLTEESYKLKKIKEQYGSIKLVSRFLLCFFPSGFTLLIP